MINLTSFTNLNSNVPWGLWVSVYIWLVGISAGTFFLIMWGNLSGSEHFKKISRLGIIYSMSTLLVGLLSIQIDLGRIERFYKLFNSPSPSSAMAWMVWMYGVYFVILAASLFNLKKGIAKPFQLLALLFALAVIFIESLLFALPPGKLWHSWIFPLHFLTSSLVSASASLLLISGIFWNKPGKKELLKGLSKTALLFFVINLIVELVDIASHGRFVHAQSVVLILSSIIAIALLLKDSSAALVTAGFIGLMSVLLSKYGGLISAQAIEPFRSFSSVYIEPRLGFNYAPNAFEIFVSILLIGLVAGLFYLLYKILPQTREE